MKKNSLIPLISIFPLLSIKLVGLILGIVFVYEFVINRAILRESIAKYWKSILILTIPFSLVVLGLCNTTDIYYGLKDVEKSLSLLLLPFVFILNKGSIHKINIRVHNLYFLASFILAIYYLIYIGINHAEIRHFDELRAFSGRLPISGEHAISFSYLIATASILSIYNNKINLIYKVILNVFYLTVIYILNTKGIIIAYMLSILLCSFIFLYKKSKIKSVIFSASFLILTTSAILFTPIKVRFTKMVNHFDKEPSGVSFDSTIIRKAILVKSYELFKEKPFFGYGTSGYYEALQSKLKEYDTKAFDNVTYGTHNQYFHFLLSNGIFGLIIWLFFISIMVYTSLKYFSLKYLAFNVFFMVAFLFENILSRNTGIVTFTLFNSLFYISNIRRI